MAKRRKKKKRYSAAKAIAAVICIVILAAVFVNANTDFSFQRSLEEGFGLTVAGGEDSGGNLNYTELRDTDGMLFFEIDAGNADSILIKAPTGETMLIDAGEDEDYPKIAQTLNELGIEKINYLVMTHAHADHIGAMDEIIGNFSVDKLIKSPLDGETKTYDSVMGAAEDSSILISVVDAGDTDTLGEIDIAYYNPIDSENDDQNQSSLVMMLRYEDTSFLCTGDIEERALDDVVSKYSFELDCDVLKVGHHGSANATTEELLYFASPEIAVIPCGEGNSYGHPHEETIELLNEAGSKILRSDTDGDIAIISDGETLSYKTSK